MGKRSKASRGKRAAAASGMAVAAVAAGAPTAPAASAWVPNAPVASRFYAYAIDWAAGGIISGLPAVLLYAALTKSQDMFTDLYVFEALGFPWAVGMLAGALCVAAAIGYYVVVPWKVWPGQTLGKHLMKLRVARADATASSVTVPQLLVRQVIVGFLFEGSAYVVARYIREMAVLLTRVDVNYYWEIAGMVVTLISAVMAFVLPARRALHDYLSGTRVVVAEGHPLWEGAAKRS